MNSIKQEATKERKGLQMYILTNEQAAKTGYLSYLPPAVRNAVCAAPQEGLCEIRLRRARPAMLYYTDGRYYIAQQGGRTKNPEQSYIVGARELIRACELVFEFSLYAHEDELQQGFVTIRGGHRIGIAGGARAGRICGFSDVGSLNYRIAHEHIGIAEPILPDIIGKTRVNNTIIISPPMCGKTSLLRDLSRALSVRGIRVGICDTRAEIAAVYEGMPGMDIADADVLSGMSKSAGMMMLLRCMSPDVIVCDELGGAEDAAAAEQIFGCGVSLLAAAHAADRRELFLRPDMKSLAKRFECVITLGGIGEIREVYHA